MNVIFGSTTMVLPENRIPRSAIDLPFNFWVFWVHFLASQREFPRKVVEISSALCDQRESVSRRHGCCSLKLPLFVISQFRRRQRLKIVVECFKAAKLSVHEKKMLLVFSLSFNNTDIAWRAHKKALKRSYLSVKYFREGINIGYRIVFQFFRTRLLSNISLELILTETLLSLNVYLESIIIYSPDISRYNAQKGEHIRNI